MKKLNTKMIAICGILTAMTIVLAEFVGINHPLLQISFNFVPIVFTAMYFGAIPCCIVAALADFVGALLFQGSVNPFLTIIAAVSGLAYGAFLYSGSALHKGMKSALCKCFKNGKNAERIAIIIIAVIGCAINIAMVTLVFTPITLHYYYGSSYSVMYTSRIPKAIVMLPLQVVLVYLLDSQLIPRLRKTSLLRGI